MIKGSTTISLLLVATVSLHSMQSSMALLPCKICPNDVCDDEDSCLYGTVRDFCGQQVCAKAPDDKCGGMFDFFGKCGAGLVCQCGRCMGCSTDTMQCSVHKHAGCDQ